MRTCIQYAITYPYRKNSLAESLDFAQLAALTFDKPDFDTFSLLSLAYFAIERDGIIPAVLNASDEVAVDAFLSKKIGFIQLFDVVNEVVRGYDNIINPSLDDIVEADRNARIKTKELIDKIIFNS